MKSALIIGGGPAGCECALWLQLLSHEVVIVEKSNRLGGQLAYDEREGTGVIGMMNQSSLDIANNMQKHIELKNIPVLFESSVNQVEKMSDHFIITVGKKKILSRTLVIATGTKSIDGGFQEGERIIIGPGFAFSRFDFKGKRVAILGGGTYAFMSYVSAMKRGAVACHIYARTIKADKNRIARVDPKDIRVGAYNVDSAELSVGGQAYDVLVVMYGFKPNFPEELNSIKSQIVRPDLSIITDHNKETPIPGIYSVGDITRQVYPCIATAMSDGVIAAKVIQKYIEKVT
jgi:thioredoxin reductase (NADPH)